jgi:hypothetical protein
MNAPDLDKRRSTIINQLRLFSDAGKDIDRAGEIALGALGYLGLRSASPGRFDVASKLFEDLAAIVRMFDVREAVLGPWHCDLATGVLSPDWPQEMCILAASIRDRLTHLLDYAVRHVLDETVPSQAFHFDALFAPDDRALLDSISRVLEARVRS